jgi:hypothetical protein
MKDPTKNREYLTDPNYYRLGYQLTAQLLNREAAKTSRQRQEVSRTGERDALDVAEHVLASTRVMLAWYCDRLNRGRWWRRRLRIKPHERRLMTFLAETVEPCTHLGAAAAIYARDPQEEERWGPHLRAVLDRERGNRLSYRAYYSLACWQAMRADRSDGPVADECYKRALEYLDTALSKAPPTRAHELAEWAKRDPLLYGLRLSRKLKGEFATLMGRFKSPEKENRKGRKPPTG